MRLIILQLIFLGISGVPSHAEGQKREITSTVQHNFSQVWVWQYEKQSIATNQPKETGEVAIYYEPETGYWLFTSEAYGISGEMIDWIVGKPDGTYVTRYTNENDSKQYLTETMEFRSKKKLDRTFPPTRNKTSFNRNSLGFPAIIGYEYRLTYPESQDNSLVHLAKTRINFAPVTHFNLLNSEAKLPIHFPWDLPSDVILLQDKTIGPGYSYYVSLKYISQAEYYIEL